jgi:hypothetical protein
MRGPAEAVVVDAEVAAGHDGQAELVVRVRHENGVVAPVTLDGPTGLRLLETPGGLAGLAGQPWRAVLARTVLGEG